VIYKGGMSIHISLLLWNSGIIGLWIRAGVVVRVAGLRLGFRVNGLMVKSSIWRGVYSPLLLLL